MAVVQGSGGVDVDRYWNEFYDDDHWELEQPSTFARYSSAKMAPGSTMFEIGCGNGRDALYFAQIGMRVLASDASEAAVRRARLRSEGSRIAVEPRFTECHIEALDDRHAGELDVVYMRFVLHAIPAEVASMALRWAQRNLAPGGLLFIEARSVLGSLYGVGEPAGRDAFFQDGHYRRFIRVEELTRELEEVGFTVDEVCEQDGLAIHGDDDPVLIRVVARTMGWPITSGG